MPETNDLVTLRMPRDDARDLMGWLRKNRPLGMPDRTFDGLVDALMPNELHEPDRIPDHTTLGSEEEWTALLAGHIADGFRIRGVDAPAGPGWYCTCGELYAGDEPYDRTAHASHVARIVAACVSDAEQQAAEKAWERGRADGHTEMRPVNAFGDTYPAVNPYRADALSAHNETQEKP